MPIWPFSRGGSSSSRYQPLESEIEIDLNVSLDGNLVGADRGAPESSRGEKLIGRRHVDQSRQQEALSKAVWDELYRDFPLGSTVSILMEKTLANWRADFAGAAVDYHILHTRLIRSLLGELSDIEGKKKKHVLVDESQFVTTEGVKQLNQIIEDLNLVNFCTHCFCKENVRGRSGKEMRNFLKSVDYAQIKEVTIESKPLITRLPAEINKFTSLHTLNVNSRTLRYFPPKIDGLSSLKVLSVTEANLGAIPSQLSKLPKLELLFITKCAIKEIPEWLCCLPSLRVLDLESSEIERIPDAIWGLRRLESLLLLNNRINTLPKSLSRLSSLTELNLSLNSLTEFPAELLSLPTQLKNVYLAGNKIANLPDQGEYSHLETLHLEGNPGRAWGEDQSEEG